LAGTGAVIIPAFNEEHTVADLLRSIRLQAPDLHVIVINDASTDRTLAVARRAGVDVLDLPVNLGAWGAIQTGMRLAEQRGYEFVLTMDADGQHLPETLNPMIDCHRSSGADIVIGACTVRGSRMRRIAWRWFRRITGLKVEDLTSGFRVYSRDAVRCLADRTATIFEYQDVGVLMMLRERGFRIHELEIRMNSRAVGSSHIFRSWMSVVYYMVHTTVMCFTKAGRRYRAPV
jgi:glycosyltransferase involved in cell wall biosynthesis